MLSMFTAENNDNRFLLYCAQGKGVYIGYWGMLWQAKNQIIKSELIQDRVHMRARSSSSDSVTKCSLVTSCILVTFVQAMACRLFYVKPLPEPMMTYFQLAQTSVNFNQNSKFNISFKMMHWKWRHRNDGHFVRHHCVKEYITRTTVKSLI